MRSPFASAPLPPASLFAHLDAHTESNFFTGFSGDLRDGGLFVATYEPLDVGETVHVELSLPGGRFVSVKGSVAWQRIPPHGHLDLSPGVGIVLHELGDEARELIETFMGLREPSFVDPDVLSLDARPRGNAVSVMPPAPEPEPEPPAAVAACEPVLAAEAAASTTPESRPKKKASRRGRRRSRRSKRR